MTRKKTLPDRIRDVRGNQSQREFAEKINAVKVGGTAPRSNIHQAAISRYERGAVTPSAWTLYRIAQLGNTKMEWLLTGKLAA